MSPTQTVLPEPVSPLPPTVAPPRLSRRRQLVEICAVVALAGIWLGLGSVLGAGFADCFRWRWRWCSSSTSRYVAAPCAPRSVATPTPSPPVGPGSFWSQQSCSSSRQ